MSSPPGSAVNGSIDCSFYCIFETAGICDLNFCHDDHSLPYGCGSHLPPPCAPHRSAAPTTATHPNRSLKTLYVRRHLVIGAGDSRILWDIRRYYGMECAVNCRLKGRLEVWAKKAPRHMVLILLPTTRRGRKWRNSGAGRPKTAFSSGAATCNWSSEFSAEKENRPYKNNRLGQIGRAANDALPRTFF